MSNPSFNSHFTQSNAMNWCKYMKIIWPLQNRSNRRNCETCFKILSNRNISNQSFNSRSQTIYSNFLAYLSYVTFEVRVKQMEHVPREIFFRVRNGCSNWRVPLSFVARIGKLKNEIETCDLHSFFLTSPIRFSAVICLLRIQASMQLWAAQFTLERATYTKHFVIDGVSRMTPISVCCTILLKQMCVCFERKFNDRLENHVSSISCFGCDRRQKCENALNAGRASFVCYSLFNIFIFTVFKRLECGSLFKLKIPFFWVQENYQPQTSSEENIELFWLVICF